MKNLLPVLILCLISSNALNAQNALSTGNVQSAKKDERYTIAGNIQGLGETEIKISNARDNQVLETTKSKAGVFSFNGSVAEPGLYWLTIGSEQPKYIYLENSAIKVTGTKADLKNIKIEGSASHKDFMAFEQTFNPLFASLNSVAGDINKATSENKKAELMPKYNKALADLHTQVEKFVTQRRNSYVSLLVLSVTMQSNENIMDVEKNFNQLGDVVKSSQMGKEISSFIAYSKVGSIGSDAMDFTQNDVNDKPVTLSSFKGKYVLVDFWASWCKPCRMENPNVVKTYNKFKDKNFTVLGVSLDQQKQAWVEAITKDKLSWTHVSDLQFWNNAAAQLYRVQSIPQNFLIDPNGKIVAKDLRGVDLEKKLCEYLGCSN